MSALLGSSLPLTGHPRYRLTPADKRVLKWVAEQCGIQPSMLTYRSNRPSIVRPRQMAHWALHRVVGLSLPEIADIFAMHHTTVLHSVETFEWRNTPHWLEEFAARVRAAADAPPMQSAKIPVPDLSGEWNC
jgi:hypothetical protein